MIETLKWESVADDPDRGSFLSRLEVPGGWLYRLRDWGDDGEDVTIMRVSLTFVPRPPRRKRND